MLVDILSKIITCMTNGWCFIIINIGARGNISFWRESENGMAMAGRPDRLFALKTVLLLDLRLRKNHNH